MHSSPASAARAIRGRRIAVVGTTGSGKSFVAKALARRLKLPYICNDSLLWNPHWVLAARDERKRRFEAALGAGAWTFDGNLSMNDPLDRWVLGRAETVVWLDLPRWRVLWQVMIRTARRVITREELWHGNRETLAMALSSDSVVRWAWTTHRRRRREYGELFERETGGRWELIRLRNRREIQSFLSAQSPGE